MLKFNINRRKLLIGSTGALSVATMPSVLRGNNLHKYSSKSRPFVDLLDPDQVASIASRAVEVAQAQGAAYSDVRIIRNVQQIIIFPGEVSADVIDQETLGINVRVLIDGYWGFAASPYCDAEEATLLAEEAVRQARANASRGPRNILWDGPIVERGAWVCPGIDPMSVTLEEKLDFVNAWRVDVSEYHDGIHKVGLEKSRLGFNRYEWCFCSSEGAKLQQIFYNSSGYFALQAGSPVKGKGFPVSLQGMRDNTDPQLGGWEVLLNARLKDRIPEMIEKSMETAGLGVSPVDIGRSNLVLDARTVSILLPSTFGKTTQLDIAIGNEANAGGTSYLGPDPYEFLGNPVAASSVTISANRSQSSGLATRKWDDEGVVPQSFDIVKDGKLMDYQTDRELSAELRKWYNSQGMNVGSRGCSSSGSGLDLPMIFSPNLELSPSTQTMSFEDLVANTERGYALFSYYMSTSFNGRDGFAASSPYSYAREIVNGRLGNFVPGIGVLFRSDELWNNVIEIGDKTTQRQFASGASKGEPSQSKSYSVSTVPISIKDIAIIDPSRRS